MSLKDKYNAAQSQIIPDEDFINALESKLNAAKKHKKRAPIRLLAPIGAVCAAAAAVVIAVNANKTVPKPIPVKNGVDSGISYSTGVFSNSGAAFTDDEPLNNQLAALISAEGAVLYESTESTFSFDDKTTDERRAELAERISRAKETYAPSNGETVYYMVSSGGTVVKFEITCDNIVKFEKTDGAVVEFEIIDEVLTVDEEYYMRP